MPDISYLFRFRDLVASTLIEHRRVIDDHGWTWWGWWKRPSEDGRADIWDQLASETTSGTLTQVGLFDSGLGKVFRATVVAVAKPENEAVDTVNVPPEERAHVPLYYRESPFSRAWLKINSIDSTPMEFFGRYSFADAPVLPNYTSETLGRFKDKKISSAEELRLMDTTIWRVRPSLDSDRTENILLSLQGVASSISFDVIPCKFNDVLHLTDMHFALGVHRAKHVWRYDSEQSGPGHTMVDAITSALHNRKIGLVIVSGDHTFIGSADEFAAARTALLHLLGNLDLSPQHLILVPGNHDIQWAASDSYDQNSEVKYASEAATLNYRNFYRSVFGHDANRHLSMGRRFSLPCGASIEICAVNSSSLETNKNFYAGMGRVDEASIEDVAKTLGWLDSKTLALRLLVIHHHLALTEDLEPSEGYGRGFGLTVDAVRIQRLAARKGVHLAIHGHKHRSFLWRSTVYELPENSQLHHRLGALSIIGGGSAASVETEANSNYFNVIEVTPTQLKLDIFKSKNKGGFSSMQSWFADLSISEEAGGLQMGEWTQKKRET